MLRFISSRRTALRALVPFVALVSVFVTANLAGPSAQAATSSLKVSGTSLVTAGGQAVKLNGVNRSGTEYNCQQGGGIFSGPTDQASIDLLKSWNINMVRIPLNEHCWLGIDWAQNSTGAAYQDAIADYVSRLADNNIYAVLDLHFTGPTAIWGEQRKEMPNRTYSVPFWKSVGSRFKSSSNVLFELYNEPHDITWSCWKNGCTSSEGWQGAGMQELTNAVRGSGATQPIILNGLDWGHDMSQLVANLPTDSAKNTVAGQHLYNFKECVTTGCWDQQFKPVANQLPLVATEIGVNNCDATLPLQFMKWMDANGGDGYGFWNFGTGGCPDGDQFGGSALITNWNGGTTPYGAGIKKYFLANGNTTPTTAPPATTSTTKAPTTTTTKPTTTTPVPSSQCAVGQYAAQYFNSTDLTGPVVASACETTVKHDWGTAAPAAGVGADNFSARWTRTFGVAGGQYNFSITGDDGIRLYIDNQLILDGWKDQGTTTYMTSKALAAGNHTLRLEYYERGGGAVAKLTWQKA